MHNKELLKRCGFYKEVENNEKGLCAFCGKDVNLSGGFKDELSLKEFEISGLCQSCQDKTFK